MHPSHLRRRGRCAHVHVLEHHRWDLRSPALPNPRRHGRFFRTDARTETRRVASARSQGVRRHGQLRRIAPFRVRLLRPSPVQTLPHGSVVRPRHRFRFRRSSRLDDPSFSPTSTTSFPRASWHRRPPAHPPSRTTRVRRLVDAPPRVRSKGRHVQVRTRTFRVCLCK